MKFKSRNIVSARRRQNANRARPAHRAMQGRYSNWRRRQGAPGTFGGAMSAGRRTAIRRQWGAHRIQRAFRNYRNRHVQTLGTWAARANPAAYRQFKRYTK